MREIVCLQAGQCGNQVGYKFWENMCQEHKISPKTGQFIGGCENDDLAMERVNVYFNEVHGGRYVPRTILTDLEPGVIDSIRGGPSGGLFNPDLMKYAQNGAGNCWAKGHYTEGAQLIDELMDDSRRLAEGCDCLQGFQVTHSLGGGTGSGLGTLILSKLREEFPDRIISTFSIFPSTKVSEVVLEPYNTILATHQLIECVDQDIVIDNEALYNILTMQLKVPSPTYGDLNHLISHTMSGVTASLRFPGQLNADLRKLCTNLTPFPRLHFFTASLAPLVSRQNTKYTQLGVPLLVEQLFNPGNYLCAADPRSGKFTAAACMFRGKVSMHEVETLLMQALNKNSSNFVEWIPHNLMASACGVSAQGLPLSATMLGNTTSVQNIFSRVAGQMRAMFHKKAFLHWYTAEGMDEMEMEEALSNVDDIVAHYQQIASHDYNDDDDGDGPDPDAESEAITE